MSDEVVSQCMVSCSGMLDDEWSEMDRKSLLARWGGSTNTVAWGEWSPNTTTLVRLDREGGEECVDTMVEHLQGSMRELESALIQLVTTSSLLRRPIDRDLVIEVLAAKGAAPSNTARRPTPVRVIETVARFFDTTPAALASRSRRRDVLVPRQLAMFLCRRFTDSSLTEIGQALGREHSAVRNAIRVVERRITERAPARYQLEAVSERVRETLEVNSSGEPPRPGQ